MGDSTRKDRSTKKGRTGVGCLILRRSRRRSTSEPPKGKRHDRQASCSPRTIKPSKIPREERYRITKTSESDSGFLSFESSGIKRNENDEIATINQQLHHSDNHNVENQNFISKSGRLSNAADISDLTENFNEFYEEDRNYDSDSISMDSTSICFRCSCMPRVFKWQNSARISNPKRMGSLGSQTVSSDENIFDLRTNALRKLSDLQNAVTESELIDKSKCFINLVYSEHRCVDTNYCNKVKFAALNAHLRTLIDCMPKSNCDCESKMKWTNCILKQAGYMSHRRNAICETTELTRKTVCRAFCNFMTLKALLRYDLL